MNLKFFARGYVIIFILCLLPIFRWLTLIPPPYRFSGLYNSMTSLGQIMGLIGVVLFASSMVLSTRWRLLESFFTGMNRVYIAHHIVGGLAFIFLMVHPLILASAYLSVSFKSAALFLLPGQDWAINVGMAALLSMMALLILTYYVELPYQIWLFTHKFLGAAFFLGALHSLFVPSDVSRDPILRWYILAIASLGLYGYLYRSVLGRFFVKRYPYTVDEVDTLSGNVYEIRMLPAHEAMRFEPGQFVFVSFSGTGVKREVHPFSLSSPPSERELSVSAKSLGDFTGNLMHLKPGTLAYVEGPYGAFSYLSFTNRDQVWVAGGIGITPFLSMARTLYKLDFRIDLYYCVSVSEEALYLDELTVIASENPKFRLIPVYTKTMGRLSADTIEKTSGTLADMEFFVCGPPPMMMSLKRQLRAKKVPREQIHSEEFTML